MTLDQIVRQNIKALMFMNNYKLKDVSKLTGIYMGNLSKSLRGERVFSLKQIELYSKAFNLEPYQLLDKKLITKEMIQKLCSKTLKRRINETESMETKS